MKNTVQINKINEIVKETYIKAGFTLIYGVEDLNLEEYKDKLCFQRLIKAKKDISFCQFINNFADLLGIKVIGNSAEKTEQIKEWLGDSGIVVMVQEAQNLTMKQLCILRHFYDEKKLSLVLFSDRKFEKSLRNPKNSKTNKYELAYISSRLHRSIDFETLEA